MLNSKSSFIPAIEVENYVVGGEWRIYMDSCLLRNQMKVSQLENLIHIRLELNEVCQGNHVDETRDCHLWIIVELSEGDNDGLVEESSFGQGLASLLVEESNLVVKVAPWQEGQNGKSDEFRANKSFLRFLLKHYSYF